MRLIHCDTVSLVHPGKVLFQDVTWSIFRGDRYGMVGANGTGKTSMLRLFVGEVEPTDGRIFRSRDLTVGYLPQEGILHKGNALFEEAWHGLPDLPSLQAELEELRTSLAENPHDPEFMERLGVLEHRWQDLEGYHAEAKVARVLSGLGFVEEDFQRRVEEFSGGWQMRIALAKLLLFDPDLLLLDEPTNHLDLPALVWLEDFLKSFEGALVVVSHDRYFLDRAIRNIGELDSGRFTVYRGTYSDYQEQRELRMKQTEHAAERQTEEKERMERFVNRFRYKASKARQVQSRIRQLEKMDDIQIQAKPKRVHFRFPSAPPSGRTVLELEGVGHKYEGRAVFENMNLTLRRGEKAALVGVNGAGKSTLCRLIAHVEEPTDGMIRWGHNVAVDYFAQEADFHLDGSKTVLEHLEAEGTRAEPERLRGLLGAFLFSGDDVFKLASVLSGGEKARLALARMLLHPSNFVILDEPTNHLDMTSQDVLLDALRGYDGTLLVVSHDRYFLDRLVDRVLEIERGVLHDWPGNLSDYLARKDLSHKSTKESPGGSRVDRLPVQQVDTSAPKSRDQKRVEAEIRNRYSTQLRKAQRDSDILQRKVEEGEKRKLELEEVLSTEEVYREPDRSRVLLSEYETLRRNLPEWIVAWEEAAQQSEDLQRERDDEIRRVSDEEA